MGIAELNTLWPAADLRLTAGNLELRWIDDELLTKLAVLAGKGVHAPDQRPFANDWSVGTPTEVAQRVLAFQWAARARITSDKPKVEFGVLVDGEPVGVQSISLKQWAVIREAATGSWLGCAHHGKGIGTRMRVLMLEFLFTELGARFACSSAFADNAASNGVSGRVGYEPDGLDEEVRDGVAATMHRYRMSDARWREVRERNLMLLGAPPYFTGTAGFRAMIETD